MKISFLLICTTILFVACNKNSDEAKTIIAGHIYKKADSTPYTNTSFVLYQQFNGSVLTGAKAEESIHPFSTDENGYFNTGVKLLKHSNGLYVCWPDAFTGEPISGINLANDSITNLIIYAN